MMDVKDMQNMMTDDELDMVVGGNATALIIPNPNGNGSYISIQSSAKGDIDKMKQLLAGGSVSDFSFGNTASQLAIPADKLDAYIDRLKSRNVDVLLK